MLAATGLVLSLVQGTCPEAGGTSMSWRLQVDLTAPGVALI